MRRFTRALALSATLLFAALAPSATGIAQDATPSATPLSIVDLCNRALLDATPVAGEVAPPDGASFDLAFVDMLIVHHERTLVIAQLAAELAEHPELADFAARTIEERAAGLEALTAWREATFASLPPLTPEQAIAVFDASAAESPGRGGVPGAREIAAAPGIHHLCAANPGEFDLEFIDVLTQHYVGALFLSRSATAYAGDEAIRNFAGELAVSLQTDVDTLQAWRALWYPDAGEAHDH